MTYTYKEIEQILRDYHWMVRDIARLRGYLEDAGEGAVRSYENMDMPRGKGGVSDPVYHETLRREKKWRRLERLEQKVRFIQDRIDLVEDERDRATLDCLLDGMRIPEIARHFGYSERQVYMIRDRIIRRMVEAKAR
jgi:hypothetical protein